MKNIRMIAVAGLLTLASAVPAQAAWTVALPFTPRAQAIRSMDINSRPNRPLHIYGTMVRRGNTR